MIRNKAVFIVALLCLAFSVTNAGDIIYVDAGSPNDPGTGTLDDPFRRIQDAINYSISGDTVEIRPGVYTGAGNYDLDPLGKSIIIRSSDPNDPEIIARTIIDPSQAGRGFYIHSGEDANCIISGLTIKNAYTTGFGAGIYCDNASPTVLNCVIKDNFSEGYGSGICSFNSTSQIRNCIISNNRGRYGGGVGCFESSSIIVSNCTIASNAVVFSGGGVFCDMEGHVVIINSIIRANKIDYPEEEYGPQVCLFEESSASISYSNIEEGLEGIAIIASTLYWLSGNIDVDPCFASFDPNGDPNVWDFHLKSTAGRWDASAYPADDLTQNGFIDLQDFAVFAAVWLKEDEGLTADFDNSGTVDLLDLRILLNAYLTEQPLGMWVQDDVSSPCLDAGDPNSEWTAELWPNGKRINMGAYGGTNQASKSGNIADFNVDGKVDFLDFAQLAGLWNEDTAGIEDLNGNGVVDVGDLDIIAANWLWEKQ